MRPYLGSMIGHMILPMGLFRSNLGFFIEIVVFFFPLLAFPCCFEL